MFGKRTPFQNKSLVCHIQNIPNTFPHCQSSQLVKVQVLSVGVKPGMWHVSPPPSRNYKLAVAPASFASKDGDWFGHTPTSFKQIQFVRLFKMDI